MDDNFPFNAGVMLLNLPYMRQTNKAFVDWIFAQENGLYYEGARVEFHGFAGACT